jgi:hypothetical protein
LVVVLIVIGSLGAILFTVYDSGGSGGSGDTGLNDAPGVGLANNTAAQQSLRSVQQVAASAGGATGFGSISAATLSAGASGATVTSGASTSAQEVSVASSGVGGTGSLTLAAYAPSGTCWYVWMTTGTTLYGSQSGQTSCQAQPMAVAPTGWSSGGFPAP